MVATAESGGALNGVGKLITMKPVTPGTVTNPPWINPPVAVGMILPAEVVVVGVYPVT